jgi:hypothetical protein
MELFVRAEHSKSLYDEYSSGDTRQASSYLDLLAHQHPGMNILKIGGSTGGGMSIILKALPNQSGSNSGSLRCARYDFIDVSPAFLSTMQEELKDNTS